MMFKTTWHISKTLFWDEAPFPMDINCITNFLSIVQQVYINEWTRSTKAIAML